MILKIKDWCEEIIVAVILCIIIESLIPNGSNKKYVKVVIGIYIMYVTFNPFFSILNCDIDLTKNFSDFSKDSYQEVSSNLNNNIKDVYILGIEENIKKEIENLGYKVEYVKVFVDINYENIEKISLKIISEKTNIVEPVIINSNIEEKSESYEMIREYIFENYLVSKENIIFEK